MICEDGDVAARAVIFDLFDTLVDGGTARRREMIARMGVDLGIDPEAFKAVFRESYRERFAGTLGDMEQTITTLIRRCGAVPDPQAVAVAARHRIDYTRRLLTPFPGVLEVLSTLVSDGLRVGLITNCSVETPQVWAETKLAQYIQDPVFSCRVGVCKPDPAIYRLALDALGVSAGDSVYVADGAGGELVGARDVGMTTIRVRAEGVDHATFGAIGDWDGPVIEDLTELPGRLPELMAS